MLRSVEIKPVFQDLCSSQLKSIPIDKQIYNYTNVYKLHKSKKKKSIQLYKSFFTFLSTIFFLSRQFATDFPLTSLPNKAIQMSTPLIFRSDNRLHTSKVLAFYRLSPAPLRRPDPPYSTFFLGLENSTGRPAKTPAKTNLGFAKVYTPPPPFR